jgi:hypothetical protein
MAADVVDLRTRAGFVPAEPGDEWSAEAPQPPAGLTFEQQQIWWDGWQARQMHEERKAEATLADASRFIQRRRVALGLRPSFDPVS